MKLLFHNSVEIKGGLSKKRVFRKYEKKLNKIIIDFSRDKREFHNFLNVYEILKKIDISIPKIYEIYVKKCLIVMEDFGEDTFDKIYNEKKIYSLLKIAVDSLIIIQNSVIEENLIKLKKYSYSNLKKEISEVITYYIPYKKISNFPTDDFYNSWQIAYEGLNFNLNSFVHKDFEFINLVLQNKKKNHLRCGIIDFQNAFVGFIGWDLFSILENSRFNFTRKYNEDLIKYFYENVTTNTEFKLFRKQYYLLNLVRQTRLLGRWIKLYKTGNKKYLNYVNPTKKRIVSCIENIHDSRLKDIYNKFLLN